MTAKQNPELPGTHEDRGVHEGGAGAGWTDYSGAIGYGGVPITDQLLPGWCVVTSYCHEYAEHRRRRPVRVRCLYCHGRARGEYTDIEGYVWVPPPARLGQLAGYLARALRDALEVFRWHPYAPLVARRWHVPAYLECPRCGYDGGPR